MANVTPAQRKIFFAYVNRYGMNRVRNFMMKVTKGITSLRDPHLTPSIMSAVIDEMKKTFPELTSPRGKKYKSKSKRQYRELRELKTAIKLDDTKYTKLCIKLIGRFDPHTWYEAEKVLSELRNIQQGRSGLRVA